MNYYQHHIGDYVVAASHLSLIEDAIYMRLLRRYYTDEQPIDNDMKKICRIVGAKSKEEMSAVETILCEFFTLQDGKWHNKRADEEIHKYHTNIKSASNAGKASAKRRYNDSSTTVQRPFNDGSTNQEPITKNHKPITKNQDKSRVLPPKRATRFGLDALPPDWERFCVENRVDLNPQQTFERFSDYWRAKSGQTATKLDWFATWRNWVRNEKGGYDATKPKNSYGVSRAKQRELDNRKAITDWLGDTGSTGSGQSVAGTGDPFPKSGTYEGQGDDIPPSLAGFDGTPT